MMAGAPKAATTEIYTQLACNILMPASGVSFSWWCTWRWASR